MIPTPHFADLLTLMARLRSDCPWDAKQTNASLQKYAIEEVFELIDAIQNDDGSPLATDDIKGELGDVLLQVIFHAHLYDEQGRFDMEDVIYTLQEKLIRRHPHVFDKEKLKTDADVKQRWDEIKRFENQHRPKRLLSDIKAGTALTTAQAIQAQAAKVGFDWQNIQGVLDKIHEEMDELSAELPSADFAYQSDKLDPVQKDKITNEIGDLLFAITSLARHLDIDSEMALQGAVAKFKRRFGFVEHSLMAQGKTFEESDLTKIDQYWELAKAYEK